MSSKRNERCKQILVASFIVLETFAAMFWYVHTNNAQLYAQAFVGTTEGSTGMPMRIIIPGIELNAAIENVSLTKDGSMGVPEDPMDAGWYAQGSLPGEMGSAVIDGHVNWWYGATGVFANLHDVKPGDLVTVQDDTGKYIYFVVREIRIYDAAADATEVFSSNDGKSHLNLITCNGAWDKSEGQYAERLVVFTDRDL